MKNMLGYRRLLLAASMAGLSYTASANLLTFDEFAHGQVITDQYAGVTISADNYDPNADDHAVVYDTQPRVGDAAGLSNEDPDLIGPNWGAGNLGDTSELFMGGVLIIQENNRDCASGICSSPDDEGTRPAGILSFSFDNAISELGFDLIDVEGPEEYNDDAGYVALLFDELGNELGRIGFGSLVGDGINNAVFGNNSVNRIAPIDLAGFGSVTQVDFVFGGSAAIDNVYYSVNEPLRLGLFGSVLLLLALRTRQLRRSR